MTDEKISKGEAKRLIDESAYGFIVTSEMEPIPSIGEVPVEEMRFNIEVNGYQFGAPEELVDD